MTSDFGRETDYTLAKIKKSRTLTILRYQPRSHGLSQFSMYIMIHRYKQNDKNRALSRVVPGSALIAYLNRFFNFS